MGTVAVAVAVATGTEAAAVATGTEPEKKDMLERILVKEECVLMEEGPLTV
jgi:hypothetical protein